MPIAHAEPNRAIYAAVKLSIYTRLPAQTAALVCAVTLVTSSDFAQASAAPPTKPTIDAIAKVAKELCARPDLYGYTRSIAGEVGGHLDVSKLVRNLLNAGVSAQAKAQGSDWSGVVQRDAAAALRDANQCTSAMFTLMFNEFYVQSATPRQSMPRITRPQTNRSNHVAHPGTPQSHAPTTAPSAELVPLFPNMSEFQLTLEHSSPQPIAPILKPTSSTKEPAELAPTSDATKPVSPPRPTPEEIVAARRHRDAGDDLFKRMIDAHTPAKIDALALEIAIWDRKGADLAVDVFGNSVRAAYQAGTSHDYFPPYYLTIFSGPQAVAAYYRRGDELDLIRHRQQALSAIFVTVPPR
jgi:hypothetical protein